MESELERVFWSKVDKSSGCWLWKGRLYRDGYGEFAIPLGKRWRRIAAHRASWMLTNRRKVSAGKEICHRCDVRACVRPDHLFEGSHSENMQDCANKGRIVSHFKGGEESYNAKLTETQVLKIYEAAAAGTHYDDLAAAYGVSGTTVRDIVRGRNWEHLKLTPLPRRRTRPPKRCVVDGNFRCCGCKVDLPVAEFFPSIIKKGNGWCRKCYAKWGATRKDS